MTYYLKSAALIVRHPVRIARYRHGALRLLCQVARREFRLHWLRDITSGAY